MEQHMLHHHGNRRQIYIAAVDLHVQIDDENKTLPSHTNMATFLATAAYVAAVDVCYRHSLCANREQQ
jgi:hypothetical protein